MFLSFGSCEFWWFAVVLLFVTCCSISWWFLVFVASGFWLRLTFGVMCSCFDLCFRFDLPVWGFAFCRVFGCRIGIGLCRYCLVGWCWLSGGFWLGVCGCGVWFWDLCWCAVCLLVVAVVLFVVVVFWFVLFC